MSNEITKITVDEVSYDLVDSTARELVQANPTLSGGEASLSSLKINNVNYKIEGSGGSGDGDGQTIQVETFPAADENWVGTIYQYVGETNTNFTNGYFYKCGEDTSIEPVTLTITLHSTKPLDSTVSYTNDTGSKMKVDISISKYESTGGSQYVSIYINDTRVSYKNMGDTVGHKTDSYNCTLEPDDVLKIYAYNRIDVSATILPENNYKWNYINTNQIFNPSIATDTELGISKPDGTTTIIDEEGTLSAVIPNSLKNPYALTINGTSYDGSSAVNMTISGGGSSGGGGEYNPVINPNIEVFDSKRTYNKTAATVSYESTQSNEYIIVVAITSGSNSDSYSPSTNNYNCTTTATEVFTETRKTKVGSTGAYVTFAIYKTTESTTSFTASCNSNVSSYNGNTIYIGKITNINNISNVKVETITDVANAAVAKVSYTSDGDKFSIHIANAVASNNYGDFLQNTITHITGNYITYCEENFIHSINDPVAEISGGFIGLYKAKENSKCDFLARGTTSSYGNTVAMQISFDGQLSQ